MRIVARVRLDHNIKRILLLAQRRPNRIRDGRHIAYAAVRHTRVWIEYLRFSGNLYPEAAAGFAVPPWGLAVSHFLLVNVVGFESTQVVIGWLDGFDGLKCNT
jgi:hypothetical protein